MAYHTSSSRLVSKICEGSFQTKDAVNFARQVNSRERDEKRSQKPLIIMNKVLFFFLFIFCTPPKKKEKKRGGGVSVRDGGKSKCSHLKLMRP